MDERSTKLALARKKLKDHQEKKLVIVSKDHTEELHLKDKEQDISCDVKHLTDKKNIQDGMSMHAISVVTRNSEQTQTDVKLTEMLIANKRNLELHVNELSTKLAQSEYNYSMAVSNNNITKQQIQVLENEIKNIQNKYLEASEDLAKKETLFMELTKSVSSLRDQNNTFQEQLELTKTMLTNKESENMSLLSQLSNLQNQFQVIQLQLQQLTNDSNVYALQDDNATINTQGQSQILLQKIGNLEHQVKSLQKDRDQIHVHYEQYVSELNGQLQLTVSKNEELAREIQNLTSRENGLINQLSDMELKLQYYHSKLDSTSAVELALQPQAKPTEIPALNNAEFNELQKQHQIACAQLVEMSSQYNELQKIHEESQVRIQELTQLRESECDHESISILKLNADIASDKIAAQRAAEQNKKMKKDLQELEESFMKMTKDKLELTEKVDAEKYLNRELTIKLAEIEEKAKDMHTKLMAKDVEMIRLQTKCRGLESKLHTLLLNSNNQKDTECKSENTGSEYKVVDDCEHNHEDFHENVLVENTTKIPDKFAMAKLQERFLKIMGEVADLSDEKHRLEHIILQLQNETDTICEYVALYQQQRCLLKKRDEERSAQIKIFQSECELLRKQLEELSGIIIKFTKDDEFSAYLKDESRKNEIQKVMNLLSKLKHTAFIDPNRGSSELKYFYPCSCCSGKLIDV